MPLDKRYCANAKYYCYYDSPVARLGAPAGLCTMFAFGRNRLGSKHISCCLETHADLRLAHSLRLSIKPIARPWGAAQKFPQLPEEGCGLKRNEPQPQR